MLKLNTDVETSEMWWRWLCRSVSVSGGQSWTPAPPCYPDSPNAPSHSVSIPHERSLLTGGPTSAVSHRTDTKLWQAATVWASSQNLPPLSLSLVSYALNPLFASSHRSLKPRWREFYHVFGKAGRYIAYSKGPAAVRGVITCGWVFRGQRHRRRGWALFWLNSG